MFEKQAVYEKEWYHIKVDHKITKTLSNFIALMVTEIVKKSIADNYSK